MAAAEAINELTADRGLGTIVKRVGLTPGAVYYHFSTRQAMVQAVIDSQHAASQKKARAIVEAGYPALEAMLRVSCGLMYDIIDDPLTRAGIRLTTEIHLLEDPPIQSWNDWMDFNRTMVTAARDEHDLKPDIDVSEVAQVLTGSIAGMHILSSLLDDLPGLAHRVRALWHQFVQAHALPDRVPYWIDQTDTLFTRACGGVP